MSLATLILGLVSVSLFLMFFGWGSDLIAQARRSAWSHRHMKGISPTVQGRFTWTR